MNEIFKGMDNAAEQINENFENTNIESGENEYGSWIKFADGTMICSFSQSEKNIPMETWGNLFRGYVSFLFPAPFTSTPDIIPIGVLATSSGYPRIGTFATHDVGTDSEGFTAVAITTDSTVDKVINLSYIAYGRWK